MKAGQLISGILLTGAGLILIILSIFSRFVLLIYGVPLFIIGIIVFFNKREDKIEQIKKRRKK